MVTGDQRQHPTRWIVVTGARGGQGTSTVAAALALHAAGPGDVVLAAPPHQGAASLLGLPTVEDAGPVAVTPHLTLAEPPAVPRADTVVIDGGLHADAGPWLSNEHAESYVVLRGPCYLALATFMGCGAPTPDGVILVAEEGRSLTARDVTEVTGLPVVATVEATPRVARTIDAGLLPTRISRLREFRQVHTLATASPALSTTSRARSNPPVTKHLKTHTDLPLSRSDNG